MPRGLSWPARGLSRGRKGGTLEPLRLGLEARARGRLERRQDVVDRLHDLEQPAEARPGITFADDPIDEIGQPAPIAAAFDQHDRLVVEAQLLPGEHLDELVERARAAG